MKRTLVVLLILLVAGILLMSSTFWSFDREYYVNDLMTQISRPLDGSVDVEYLKEEFSAAPAADPAYGY